MVDFNPMKMVGMVLDPGSSQRNANVNPGYITPKIKNPEYDKDNPYGIDPETERVVIIDGKAVVIGENAPRGLRRLWAGLRDKMDPSQDRDQRGSGSDAWGDLPETGYGRRGRLVDPYINNPAYPGDPDNPDAAPVPEIDEFGNVVNRVGQDVYSEIRDGRLLNQRLAMEQDYLKEANYYRMMLDQAELNAFLNTSRGMAGTNLLAQQSQYLADAGKAEKIKAIAERQEAANEFGELGLQRTYFTV